MKVGTPTHRNSIRLAGAAALAAILGLGAATLAHSPDPAGTPASGTIVHAPSAAYLDFAHSAFDRFRDAPPEQNFDAAEQAGSRPSRI